MTDAVVLDDVTKRYGDFTAVDGVSLRLPRGRICGFLGPNGAGKTTLIRMIMSILYPDAGRIRVLDHDNALSVKDRIGYLPEERGLYRKMTVDKTLRYFGRLKGLSGARLRERIDTCLERVELLDWRHKPVEALSKGMSQKLQFVTTILHEPELVILDEPFSGLDPLNMEVLKQLMLHLRERGVTVIFSTHQMDQAQRLCDRLILINRGRLLVEGTLEEIRAPFSSRVLHLDGEGDFASLAQVRGVVEAHVVEGHARLELGDGIETNEVLRQALSLGRVSRFEVQRLDLHDIFVRLVRGHGDDVPDEPVPAGTPIASSTFGGPGERA